MHTHVELETYSNKPFFLGTNPTCKTIGYLRTSPKKVLEAIFPRYDVVNFKGIPIHLKNNEFRGLKITSLDEGVGITGSLDELFQEELFKQCRRTITNEQKEKMVNNILKKFRTNNAGLLMEQFEDYQFVLGLLGKDVDLNELELHLKPRYVDFT